MRCYKSRRKLAAFVAGQLSLFQKEELQDHVEACLNCRKQLAALEQLDHLLSVYPLVETGPNFAAIFWQKVRELEAKQVKTVTVGAYFYRFALVILFFSLAVGVASGIFTAKYNARGQVMSELKIDYLRDYPPNSLSGNNIVLASLK